MAPWLDVTVPATARNATALRGTFRHWVDSILTDDAADDLTLAVYEALANAAEHAFTAHSEAYAKRSLKKWSARTAWKALS